MSAIAVDNDLFEWTVSDVPFTDVPSGEWIMPGEAPASATRVAPETVRQAVSFFHSVSGVLLAAVGVVLLTVWLAEGWQGWATEQAVREVFTREERAALRGDAAALQALSGAADSAWLEQRLDRMANGLIAPSPLRGLRPANEAGQLQTVTRLAADLYQADITREYLAADGQGFAFTLPQFYQRREGEWQRALAPESFWGARSRLAGRRIEIELYAVDRDFGLELLPYLDDVLARFCAHWGCGRQLPIVVDLANRYYQWPDVPVLQRDDPLLFSVLPPHVTRFPDYALLVPSPHDVGFPADEASRDLLRRAIAVQVVFAALDRAAFSDGRRDAVGNGFFYALVVRESVRLGLDPASVLDGAAIVTPEQLTAQRYWDFRGGVWRRPDVIRNTVVMLNAWLADAPADTDLALLRQIPTAHSPETWLAAGTGRPLDTTSAEVAAMMARLNALR